MKKVFLYKTILMALCLAVAAALAPAPVKAAPVTLTYANFPPASTFPCVQMERWVKEIEKRTNSQVKINTFPGGTLLPAKNIFDGVIAGTADIGNFAMSYQPGRFPVSEAVDLPLGFPNARVASLILTDLIEKYKPKEFEKVKILTLFTCPPADFMTNKPVRTLKDLKGMELRVSGTGADVVKNLGGIPIAMPQSETPEAIQKGIVKGVVSSLEVLKDMNYAAYCPFATDMNLFVVSFAVVMNREKWNALPADVKKAMDDLRVEQAEWTGRYVDNHVAEALTWSKEKYGHQVIQLPAADKAEIRKLVAPMIDDYVKKVNALGLPGAEIVAEIERLKMKYDKKGEMMATLDKIDSLLGRFLSILSGAAVLALMLLATGNVVLRIFHAPFRGTYEIVSFLGAIGVAFALATTQRHKGNIVVDILSSRYPRPVKRLIDTLSAAISSIFFGIVAWQVLVWGTRIMVAGEVSETLKVVYHPFVFGVAAGFGILTLTCLLDIRRAFRKDDEEAL